MSFRTWSADPGFGPESGWTRETIAGMLVDWITTKPSAADVTARVDGSDGIPSTKQSAKNRIETDLNEFGRLERAIVVTALNEINNLRQWIASFRAEVAAATSLADLKTRVAGLPNMPDRTKTQLISTIKDKIDGDE